MNAIVRRTPRPTPPALKPLPDALPLTPQGTGRRTFLRRALIGGVAAVAAASLGVLVGPRLTGSVSFAAEVRDAIAQANTWHFSGWRLVEGKRVPWEIWGRRAPFFYREQIGDNLLITDDKQQLRIVPPGDHRPDGLALTLPAAEGRKAAALTQSPESFIVGIGGEFLGRLKQVGRQGNEILLQSPVAKSVGIRQMDEQGLLVVDAGTKLPIRYTLKRAVRQEIKENAALPLEPLPVERAWTQAELKAEYNVPIPDGVTVAAAPPNFAKVNLLETASGPTIPAEGTGAANGITVHANVLSQDAEGNLHVRFDSWFGQQKHFAGLPLQLWVQSQGIVADGKTNALMPSLQDDLGNIYVPLSHPVGAIDTVNPEWYLAPLEPFKPGQPRPKTLTAHTYVSASWYEYLPEARTGTTHDLTGGGFTLTIPLPETAAPTDYDTRPVPHGIQLGDGRSTLALDAALARVRLYRGGIAGKEQPDRVNYWQKVALDEAKRAPISKRYRSLLERELSPRSGQP